MTAKWTAPILLLAVCAGPTWGQEPGGHGPYRDAELGLTFRAPGGGSWERAVERRTGGTIVRWTSAGHPLTSPRLVLSYWPASERSLRSVAKAALEMQEDQGQQLSEPTWETRTFQDEAALGQRYMNLGEPPLQVDVTYFRREGITYRLVISAGRKEARALRRLRREAVKCVSWEAPVVAVGHVLTVVHATSKVDAPYQYLEALPGAARANGGRPVLLLVGDRLTPPALALIRKFEPERIRLIGPRHAQLPRAEAADDVWGRRGTVVVSQRQLGHAVGAATLAARLDAPLLVVGADLVSRLSALEPKRIFVVGTVRLPKALARRSKKLSSPLEVARACGGGDYVALCNVGEGSGAETAVFAAALAATHRGVVLPIEETVRSYKTSLAGVRKPPTGMNPTPTGLHGVGTIVVEGGEVSVAVPVLREGRLFGRPMTRFGRPRLDLDGDGSFAEDEEQAVGATVQVAGDRYVFTARYQSPLGGRASTEILLLQPDPAAIQEQVRAFSEALGGAKYLALVGTPARIPFCLVEQPAFYDSYEVKAELAGDAPYGDLDDDVSLELAVGRLLPTDLEQGSASIATTIAYPQLRGSWKGRATLVQPGFAEKEVAAGGLPWVFPEAEAMVRAVGAELEHVGVKADGFFRDQVDVPVVLDSLRQAGWIVYFNHSSLGAWWIHPGSSITAQPEPSVENREHAVLPQLEGAPIVYGGGCLSAGVDLTETDRTMAGRFFQLGAVAYLGNTRVASVGTQPATQLFFTRLTQDGATLGEAYRDGRNFLAHLLEQGAFDPGLMTGLVGRSTYERIWGQFHLMNLFGDPALRPHLPNPVKRPALSIELKSTSSRQRLRLVVEQSGPDRRDPVLMMPAPGKGEPREAFVRTALGLTYGSVPAAFLARGLSPLRSFPQVPPGAWVDVALPRGGRDVTVNLVEGPAWCERGFSVERDGSGPARLRMFVPLVRATLESGEGEIARKVEFEVVFTGRARDRLEPRRAPGKVAEATWREVRRDSSSRVSPEARELLDQVRGRIYLPREQGLRRVGVTSADPLPRLLGGAQFQADWEQGGQVRVTVSGVEPWLEAHQAHLAEKLRPLLDPLVWTPYDALEGCQVVLGRGPAGEVVLVAHPLGEREGDERIRLVLAGDGLPTRLERRRFGVEETTRFEWKATPRGAVLARRVEETGILGTPLVTEWDYEEVEGFLLPTGARVDMSGLLSAPRWLGFDFTQVEGDTVE